ncbi:Conserved_hypothetical protein [Hexamita inflata]|uniref:Uncharacterized protein n=1 Tax=Hexamita inflata TaxID=28002 RepID=A0AA86N5D1_9EUKA|nr:Conserved hypothetical protein [Hexamita inflata]
MLTKVQTLQFGAALKFVIEQIINQTINSDLELFKIIKQFTLKERTGIWRTVGNRINSTANEAHDYYFNTWTLQFYQDHKVFQEILIQLFYDQIGYCTDAKEAIKLTINEFQKQYPLNNCNERKMYQLLYRINSAKDQSSRKIVKITQCIAYEEYEQFRFQSVVDQLNMIE